MADNEKWRDVSIGVSGAFMRFRRLAHADRELASDELMRLIETQDLSNPLIGGIDADKYAAAFKQVVLFYAARFFLLGLSEGFEQDPAILTLLEAASPALPLSDLSRQSPLVDHNAEKVLWALLSFPEIAGIVELAIELPLNEAAERLIARTKQQKRIH